MDKVWKLIDIPKHLHGYLISKGGIQIRNFQTKHKVAVTFNQDQAVVKGAKKNVNQAVKEICQVCFPIFFISDFHF